jgi:hypothetical protein
MENLISVAAAINWGRTYGHQVESALWAGQFREVAAGGIIKFT